MTRTLSVTLITLGDPATLTGGYLFHRRLAELAPRHHARLTFVSVPERPFPLALLDGAGVYRAALATAPDALVVDSICTALLALSPPPRGIPLLGMLHQPPGGIDYGPPRSTVQGVLDRLMYRRLGRLLVASDALRADLLARGSAADHVHVVPPGRDVAAAAESGPGSTRADLRQGRRAALLSVGNWVARKGVVALLDAVGGLPASAATLHLVGSTSTEPRYARQVWARLAAPDLRGRVVVHGPLPVNAVAGLYAAADAFVLPSLKEPYGTVYGEAMACGLPVVGWTTGNLPYLARDGVEGLLASPGDIEGLRDALWRLIDDPALRERLGAAALVAAQARPTWDEVAARFFDHVRQAVESGQSTGPDHRA